jgi:uncharacterized membrane protein YgcG
MRPVTSLAHIPLPLLLLLLVAVLMPAPVAAQDSPGPRPAETPYFHDAHGLFDDKQLATLERDGELLQSSGIPTLVYVRNSDEAQASIDASQAFADELRQDWGIASAPDADDGLVLLFSWVPRNPAASTAVFSYGSATFEGSGLTPASIQHTIDTSVASLIEQEKPYEAVVYFMRETRYDGIYAPPPPAPIEGAVNTAHVVVRWMGPALVATTALILAWLTARYWQTKPSHTEVGRIVVATIAGSALFWALSVYARSRVGVASSLLILLALGIAAWIWSRAGFVSHGSPFVRHRNVPSTNRLMRKRHQARVMSARSTGGKR